MALQPLSLAAALVKMRPLCARICDQMSWCGLQLDPPRNAAARGTEAQISADNARLHAYVIPVDEAVIIARDTAACLGTCVTHK